MVNVNTPVSSSMELPFGEYTLFFIFFGFNVQCKTNRLSVAAAGFLCVFVAAAAALPDHDRS